MFSSSDELYDVSWNYIVLSVTNNFGLAKIEETTVNYYALGRHWSIGEYLRKRSVSVIQYAVKFPHSPILHYAFSSWLEKIMTKTIHCHWENRFVLQ